MKTLVSEKATLNYFRQRGNPRLGRRSSRRQLMDLTPTTHVTMVVTWVTWELGRSDIGCDLGVDAICNDVILQVCHMM